MTDKKKPTVEEKSVEYECLTNFAPGKDAEVVPKGGTIWMKPSDAQGYVRKCKLRVKPEPKPEPKPVKKDGDK